jgi:predicted O-methyltransferase YrrM
MDIVDPAVDRYLRDLVSPRDPILREMELLAAEREFPIVGPVVGRLLQMLCRAIRARRVIELGSGFGYSAFWLARGVGPEGKVVLAEHSAAQAAQAVEFLRRGGLYDRVQVEVGDALEVIERVGGEFDLVFNDIDKADYPRVFELAAAALRPGGLLVSDNMLWFGKVLEEQAQDPETRGIRELTRLLHESEEFDTVLLPIRDGVTVSTYRA